MKKKKYIFIIPIVIIVLVFLGVFIYNNYIKSGLTKLTVNEVVDKVNNKESFVLCISQTECTHCQAYKPKLKNISRKYNIEIFYIDIDKYDNDEKNKFRNYVPFDGSTPVTAFIINGEETTTSNRIIGNVSSKKIIERLQKNGFIK